MEKDNDLAEYEELKSKLESKLRDAELRASNLEVWLTSCLASLAGAYSFRSSVQGVDTSKRGRLSFWMSFHSMRNGDPLNAALVLNFVQGLKTALKDWHVQAEFGEVAREYDHMVSMKVIVQAKA